MKLSFRVYITALGSSLLLAVLRGLLASLLRTLYRIGLRGDHVVFFQNEDDERLFRELRLVGRGQRCVRIAGSGIDLAAFPPAPMPAPPVRFLMIARLLRDKGLHEYIQAARRVRSDHPAVTFGLLGPLDPNPEGITARAERLEAPGRAGLQLRAAVTPGGTSSSRRRPRASRRR